MADMGLIPGNPYGSSSLAEVTDFRVQNHDNVCPPKKQKIILGYIYNIHVNAWLNFSSDCVNVKVNLSKNQEYKVKMNCKYL